MARGSTRVAAIATTLGVSRASIYRHLTARQPLTRLGRSGVTGCCRAKPYCPDPLLHAIYGPAAP